MQAFTTQSQGCKHSQHTVRDVSIHSTQTEIQAFISHRQGCNHSLYTETEMQAFIPHTDRMQTYTPYRQTYKHSLHTVRDASIHSTYREWCKHLLLTDKDSSYTVQSLRYAAPSFRYAEPLQIWAHTNIHKKKDNRVQQFWQLERPRKWTQHLIQEHVFKLRSLKLN
jgi:hypothetical protein